MFRLAFLVIAMWSLIVAEADAQTNAVPAARSSLGEVVVDGLHQGADVTLKAADAAIEGGKAVGGEIDKAAAGFIGKAGEATDAAGHVIGAYKAYRDEGAEGMAIYGVQELGETVLDNAAERLAGPAAPAWRFGRAAGNVIKQNVKINGFTIEDHVANFYFDNLHGRWANDEFERNTSEEAIARHREKMRRAGIFTGAQRANEQAAAHRAASAAQQSAENGDAEFAAELMLMLTPALVSAAQSQEQRVYTAPPPSPPPGNAYVSSRYEDPRPVDRKVSGSGDNSKSGSGHTSRCIPPPGYSSCCCK